MVTFVWVGETFQGVGKGITSISLVTSDISCIYRFFSGNFNRNKTVKQILCSELVAKRLRFIPKEHYGNCCMRVEIYGIPLAAGKKQHTFIMIEERQRLRYKPY